AVDSTYTCTWTSAGVEPEGSMDVVITAVEAGSGNVALRTELAALLFDYTAPTLLLSDGDVVLESNPVGQLDRVSVPDGTLAPYSIVELYQTSAGVPSIPVSCGSYAQVVQLTANALGGIPWTEIGDDTLGAFRVRALDAAGNDRCDPACLDACIGTYCPPTFMCCPQGGVSIDDCDGYVTLCNDTEGPTVALQTAVQPVTASTDASFVFSIQDWGCPVASEPLVVRCRVDDAAFADCPATFSVNVGPGTHRLEYFGVDGLGHATRDYAGPVVYSMTWRVQAENVAFDATKVGVLGGRGMVVDGGGTLHLVVGGEVLTHWYRPAAGTFTSEVVSTEATVDAAVTYHAGTLYLAHTTADGDLALAMGTTGSWSTELVETGARVVQDSIDIATDSAGVPTIAYQPRRGELWQDEAAPVIRTRLGVASWGEAEQVSATSGWEVRLAFDSTDRLWVYWTVIRNGGGWDRALLTRVRDGGTWGGEFPVADNLGNTPPNRRYPTLLIDATDNPLVSYRDGYDSESAELEVFNGTDWSDAALNLTYLRYTAATQASDGDAWYVFAGPTSAATLGIQRFDGAGLEGATWAGLGARVESTATAVLGAGTLATAQLAIGFSYVESDNVAQLGYGELNGSAAASLVTGERIDALSLVRGAPTPTALISMAGSNRLMLATYDEFGNAFTSQIVASGAAVGAEAVGVYAASGTWVAHRDPAWGQTTAQLFVEHDDGSGFVSLGAVTSPTDFASQPTLALADNGQPFLAYRLVSGAVTSIVATWYNGATFVAPPTLASSVDVVSIAAIGDSNGAQAGGEAWVVYGTGSGGVHVVKVNRAGEDPAVPGCETCTSEALSTTLSGDVGVAAGLSPLDAPVVLFVPLSGAAGGNTGPLTCATYSGSAWTYDDLSSRLVAQAGVPGQNLWAPSVNQAIAAGAQYFAAPRFAYDSAGLLRLALIVDDQSYTEGQFNHYVLARELASGDIEAYPVWPFVHGYDGAVGDYRPIRPLGDVAVRSDDAALFLWPDVAVEDVQFITEAALVP
ncbi:MAG: hypothetical protein AAB426_01170, partial [Myxococcota bacterium]